MDSRKAKLSHHGLLYVLTTNLETTNWCISEKIVEHTDVMQYNMVWDDEI